MIEYNKVPFHFLTSMYICIMFDEVFKNGLITLILFIYIYGIINNLINIRLSEIHIIVATIVLFPLTRQNVVCIKDFPQSQFQVSMKSKS